MIVCFLALREIMIKVEIISMQRIKFMKPVLSNNLRDLPISKINAVFGYIRRVTDGLVVREGISVT